MDEKDLQFRIETAHRVAEKSAHEAAEHVSGILPYTHASDAAYRAACEAASRAHLDMTNDRRPINRNPAQRLRMLQDADKGEARAVLQRPGHNHYDDAALQRIIFQSTILTAYKVAKNYARKAADVEADRVAHICVIDVAYGAAHHVASHANNNAKLYNPEWALTFHQAFEAARPATYEAAHKAAWPAAFDAAYTIMWPATFEAALNDQTKNETAATAAAARVAETAQHAARQAANAPAVIAAALSAALASANTVL